VHSPPLTNIFTSLILTMNIIFMKKKCLWTFLTYMTILSLWIH